MTTLDIRREARIVWAIASKDIVDALKNKTTLTSIGTVVFLLVVYRFLPALESSNELPRMMVYDQGASRLVAELENSDAFRTYVAESVAQVEDFVSDTYQPRLGLVLPADLDQALDAGQTPTLRGLVVHWAGRKQVAELQLFYEEQLSQLAGQPVRIDLEGEGVYPQTVGGGRGFLTSMAVLLALSMMGISTVTHLILEEKQTKTLDALLVSPASIRQVVMGKALAGLFYCLAGAGAVFALNAALILQWGLAVVAVVCGALFTVALGLLLGSIFEDKQQMTLWGFLVFNVLLVPAFLSIMTDLLPAKVIAFLRWVPTVALATLLRTSFTSSVPLGSVLGNLALLVASAGVVYAAVVWRVRRTDV